MSSNPAKAEASAGDYETLSNRVNELEKRVERLEQKSSQNNEENIVITPSIPSPQDNFEKELHNVQTAVMAMLADSKAGILDAILTLIDDMDLVTSDSGALVLSNYLTALNADGTVKSGCTYDFARDGTVTQRLPTTSVPSSQEDYYNEWCNIQTAVMAMLADSSSSIITAGTDVATNDMDNITTDGGTKVLSNYLTGLNPDGTVKSGCTYVFALDGTVTQIIP